jgi:predicted nucleotidyltransferase component of viral defense system
MMSYNQFKAKSKNLADELGINPEIIHRHYYFDRILERIAQSKFRNYIMLKGGVLITSLFGLDYRSTRDLDMEWKGDLLSKEMVEAIFSDIASCNLDDGVTVNLKKISPIGINFDRLGWRVMLELNFTKMRPILQIDLFSDDFEKVHDIEYSHKLLFEDRCINICSQSKESILVDKFLATFKHGIENYRQKDFYDMFVFTTIYAADISPQVFADLLNHAVKKRGIQLGDVRGTIASIRASTELQSRWEQYQGVTPYAASVTFQQTVEALAKLAKWAGFGPLNSRAGRSFGPR